jgi:hypothetical protein
MNTSASRFESSRTSISALLPAGHNLSGLVKQGKIVDGRLIPVDDDSGDDETGEELTGRAALKSGSYLPGATQSTTVRKVRDVRPPAVMSTADAFVVVARDVRERSAKHGQPPPQGTDSNSFEGKRISRFKAGRM